MSALCSATARSRRAADSCSLAVAARFVAVSSSLTASMAASIWRSAWRKSFVAAELSTAGVATTWRAHESGSSVVAPALVIVRRRVSWFSPRLLAAWSNRVWEERIWSRRLCSACSILLRSMKGRSAVYRSFASPVTNFASVDRRSSSTLGGGTSVGVTVMSRALARAVQVAPSTVSSTTISEAVLPAVGQYGCNCPKPRSASDPT